MPRTTTRRKGDARHLALAAAMLLAGACSSPAATARAYAAIVLDPPSLDFGDVPVTGTAARSVTLRNDGTAVMTLAGAKIANDTRHTYTFEGLPPTLERGASATVVVTYTAPPEPGSDGASLVIENDSENAQNASVTLVARAVAATCDDKFRNGHEAGVDCGGDQCRGCRSGEPCRKADDCAEGLGCNGTVCGACADASNCRAGQVCKAGLCGACQADAECPSGFTCDRGACTACPGAEGPIDTRTDVKNCGACNHACPVPVHAAATCIAGACGRAPCEAGYYDLDGAATYGCESSCRGKSCSDGVHVVELSSPPIPEAGNVFSGIAAGSSFGAQVQTNGHYTNMGVLGEPTPPNADRTAVSSDASHRNIGGLKAVLRP